MEIHPTEMSLGENDCQKVLQCLTLKMSEGAQKAKSLSSACIFRVPQEIRKLNESAYTPRLIAIGPLHRNDPHLKTPMQHVKMSYMNDLLCRVSEVMEDLESATQKKITVLQECMAAMKALLHDAKKCYAEEVTLDEEMLLVDGCFILELLYKLLLGPDSINSEGLEDPIVGNTLTCFAVQQDLLLLENQIPFLVLERLFPLTLARTLNLEGTNLSLTDFVVLPFVAYRMRPAERNSTKNGRAKISCWLRDCILWVSSNKTNSSKHEEKVPSEQEDSTKSGSAKTSCWPRNCVLWVSHNKTNNSKPEEKVSSPSATYYHILHKLHDDFLPHDHTGKGVLCQYMSSASELLYAGVKFVSGTGNDLFKVKFTEPEGPFWWCRSARFEIPPFKLVDSMEPMLRNFIAFEQCCPGISEQFTSYACLMDMLVNSDIDVQVLEKAGVVDNWLGASKDVTDLFNKLCKGVVTTEFFFADTCERATRYSKRFWPKHMAYLRRQYFASPWTFIAFCLGFIYFGITIAQLITSII